MGADAVFVDANVLVYGLAEASPWHTVALQRMQELSLRYSLWTSRQVLREVLATGTRNRLLWPSMSVADWAEAIRRIERLYAIADEDSGVTAMLLRLCERPGATGRQVHDANIVATMLRYNIRYLLTHNVADFRRYEPEIEIVPPIV